MQMHITHMQLLYVIANYNNDIEKFLILHADTILLISWLIEYLKKMKIRFLHLRRK